MNERKLQTEIIKFFKAHGAYVIKTRPGMGTPVGCPDVIALYLAKHCEVEVKSGPSAPYQPGQEATLNYLRRGGRHSNRFVYRVDPTNWEKIKTELLTQFFNPIMQSATISR